MLTHTYGKKGGLVVMLHETTGMPNPDRRAAKLEALECLERAEKEKSEDEALEVRIRHSAYDPGNSRTGIIELVFR